MYSRDCWQVISKMARAIDACIAFASQCSNLNMLLDPCKTQRESVNAKKRFSAHCLRWGLVGTWMRKPKVILKSIAENQLYEEDPIFDYRKSTKNFELQDYSNCERNNSVAYPAKRQSRNWWPELIAAHVGQNCSKICLSSIFRFASKMHKNCSGAFLGDFWSRW